MTSIQTGCTIGARPCYTEHMRETDYQGEKVKTQAQFKKKAVANFKKANPDAADVTVEWGCVSKKVKWHDGSYGWSGSFVAKAAGYETKRVVASGNEDGSLLVK